MSGASGRTLTRAQRKARGDVQVAVWLDATEARALAALEAQDPRREGARSRAVRQAILDAHQLHLARTNVHPPTLAPEP